MNRIHAVRALIERHTNRAQHHVIMHNIHTERVNQLKAYLYELEKPGFNTSGWRRYTGSGRTEPYVIQASDTFKDL